jgi:hypothetical protein
MNRPEHFSAFQLAAFWSDYLALRKHVERESEQLTLIGPFSHRKPPRHAPRNRFAHWRLRLRTAALSRCYAAAPLLGGLRP